MPHKKSRLSQGRRKALNGFPKENSDKDTQNKDTAPLQEKIDENHEVQLVGEVQTNASVDSLFLEMNLS